MTSRWLPLFLWVLAPLVGVQGGETAGILRWHSREHRVDADLQNWPLEQTLKRIAAATGWEVFVEPGLDAKTAARFEDRPERQALATLLSDLNFALVPSSNATTRLLVFRSTSTRATVSILPPKDADIAKGGTNVLSRELVVRLKRGAKTDIQALARKLGARVMGSIDSLNAHRLAFDDAEAAANASAALAAEEDVDGVESNYALGAPTRIESLPDSSAPPLNLKARPLNDGSTVVVALLDTGIPSSGVPNSEFLLPGLNINGGSGSVATEAGITHGPAMFETILQALSLSQQDSGKPVRVLPVDIYGGGTETSTFQLAQGIVAALDHGADILNLSLSGPNPSPLLHDVLQQASAAGVLSFAAPGNEPTTNPTYPAAYPEVVAVTASDRAGGIASYANRGSFVDLITPGTSVVPFAGEAWMINGTSVSTANAAGLAAGLLAASNRPASEIIAQMRLKLGFQAAPATPVHP